MRTSLLKQTTYSASKYSKPLNVKNNLSTRVKNNPANTKQYARVLFKAIAAEIPICISVLRACWIVSARKEAGAFRRGSRLSTSPQCIFNVKINTVFFLVLRLLCYNNTAARPLHTAPALAPFCNSTYT